MKYEEQKKIYDDLFQMVENNLRAAGKELDLKKETFLSMVGESREIIDVSKWHNFENDVFLEVAYYHLLERLPDSLALKMWKGKMKKAKKVVHRDIITSILNSQEYSSHNTYVVNNMYSLSDQPDISLRFRIREFMYRIYKKFPEPLKQVIRKILRVY